MKWIEGIGLFLGLIGSLAVLWPFFRQNAMRRHITEFQDPMILDRVYEELKKAALHQAILILLRWDQRDYNFMRVGLALIFFSYLLQILALPFS